MLLQTPNKPGFYLRWAVVKERSQSRPEQAEGDIKRERDGCAATDMMHATNESSMISSALFSSEKWKLFGTVALSFVCDKYYPIMN